MEDEEATLGYLVELPYKAQWAVYADPAVQLFSSRGPSSGSIPGSTNPK